MNKLIKGANWATDGIIECSYFHYTEGLFPASSYETQGIDFHEGRNWIIRDNKFRNIRIEKGATQSSNGAAVIMWDRTDSVLVERNLVINCDAAFKLGASWYDDESDRMTAINNLIIYNETDTRWEVSNIFEVGRDVSRGGFYHNTVWNPTQDPGAAFVYCPNDTFPFENNLYYIGTTHRAKGAQNNVIIGDSTWFKDVGQGDFRLNTNHTVPAIQRVSVDINGAVRANPPTAGAFEFIVGQGIKNEVGPLSVYGFISLYQNPIQLQSIIEFINLQRGQLEIIMLDTKGNLYNSHLIKSGDIKPGIYFLQYQVKQKRILKEILILE